MKTTTKYKVTYWFVDSTYWDDGNRTTSRKKEFKSYDEAVAFSKKIVAEGTEETSAHSRKTEKFRIERDNVLIEEITSKQYPWWGVFDDSDYIEEKIASYLKYDHFKMLAEFQTEVEDFYDKERFYLSLKKAKERLQEKKK